MLCSFMTLPTRSTVGFPAAAPAFPVLYAVPATPVWLGSLCGSLKRPRPTGRLENGTSSSQPPKQKNSAEVISY